MEYLPHGLTLHIPDGCFPLSTDSMVLSHFAKLPRCATVLDFGSGCGTLGTLLCATSDSCTVTGVELTYRAHEAALENIRRNALQHRMQSICCDLRDLPPTLQAGSFHCCISNPPYFSAGPASLSLPFARQEDCCSPEQLFSAASKALRYGGDFFLVHKPERLAELIACASGHGLEAKRLRLVRHSTAGAITLILLSFRKGGKPGLIIDECSLRDLSGQPTAYYRDVYHILEA